MKHPALDGDFSHDPDSPIAIISRATSRTALLATLRVYLHDLTGARSIQIMWQADGSFQPLYSDQPTAPVPPSLDLSRLRDGQAIRSDQLTIAPMIVLGDLRGWAAFDSPTLPTEARELLTHVGAMLAVMERPLSEQAPSRELAVIEQIGRLLSSTLQLDQLLANIGKAVREIVRTELFFIALANESQTTLSFAYSWSIHGMPLGNETWPIDQGLSGLVVRQNRPIVADDYLRECRRWGVKDSPLGNTINVRAWIGVPLSHQDRVLGVLVSMHDQPNAPYTDADMHLLSSIAAQAAAAVAHAQLYRRVEQQAHQLALINRIGKQISATLDPQEIPALILHELQQALDVDDGTLLIAERGSGELVARASLQPRAYPRLPSDAGIVGQALRTRQVVIASGAHDDPLSAAIDGRDPPPTIMCAPLVGRQQLVGAIHLRNKRSGPFTEHDAQFLSAIAEQASVALENAELYAHTDSALTAHIADLEQRNRQLNTIVQISNALRATTNVDALCRFIATTIQTMTGSPRVLVSIVEREQQRISAQAYTGIDVPYRTGPGGVWTPLETVVDILRQSRQIGTMTYDLGEHLFTPGFENSILITLRESNSTLIGVIIFDQVDLIEPLSTALIQELEIVANQAAGALVNAQLANEREQTVDRLTALSALSLAVTTSKLSTGEIVQMTLHGAIGTTNGIGGGALVIGREAQHSHIVLDLPPDSDRELLDRLSQPIDEYAVVSGANVPEQLVRAGVMSLLIVPVRGAQQTLGSMWIAYGDSMIAPTEREMAVLYAKTAGGVLENQRLIDQVSAAHARLAAILASTAEGMLMVTDRGEIVTANDALARMLSLPLDSIEGRSVDDVFAAPSLQGLDEQIAPLRTALSAVAARTADDGSGDLSLLTPAPCDLAWSVRPVRGQMHAALLVLRDVTAERQAEQLRQDLANMIVHDLRAPLTNMMVSIELLLKQTGGQLSSSQKRIVEIAGTSSQQMLDLVNTLLDIRKLEQRQLDVRIQPIELFELVESAFDRLGRIAESRQIAMVNETVSLSHVQGDMDLISRVLQNLLDNAMKFSPRGSTIRVSGTIAADGALPEEHVPGQWLIIDVADQGPGVPDAYRQVIFQLFGQSPQNRNQGTGLGLAFCRLAVKAHGGMIWVEDGANGGAVFRFTIPLFQPRRRRG